MNKTVILGAGATYGASIINNKLKPPLLKDLPDIISSKLISLNNSKDGPSLANGFNDLILLTKTKDNIEIYFTVLHILGILSRKINPKIVFISNEEIIELLNSNILQKTFMNTKFEKIARIILEYYLQKNVNAFLNYPFNFQNFFQNSLREYFYHSLTNCFCIYHEKLFADLTENDVVVNFNYDEIGDFTLFTMNKLSHKSFENLPFNDILFPKEISKNCIPVKYLKIHGSFNWSKDIDKPLAYYNLISEACGKIPIGNTSFPIILPTISKNIIYNQYPIFASHIYEFSKSIEQPQLIYLVGKSFLNSDSELNNIIKQQRMDSKCKLVIIDPNCKDLKFIEYHEELFNGKCIEKYETLENYFNNIII